MGAAASALPGNYVCASHILLQNCSCHPAQAHALGTRVTKNTSRQAVEDQIANIIGTLPQFTTLNDQHGQPWTTLTALDDQIITVNHLNDYLEEPEKEEQFHNPRPKDPDYDSDQIGSSCTSKWRQQAALSRSRAPERDGEGARRQRQFVRQMNQAANELQEESDPEVTAEEGHPHETDLLSLQSDVGVPPQQ